MRSRVVSRRRLGRGVRTRRVSLCRCLDVFFLYGMEPRGASVYSGGQSVCIWWHQASIHAECSVAACRRLPSARQHGFYHRHPLLSAFLCKPKYQRRLVGAPSTESTRFPNMLSFHVTRFPANYKSPYHPRTRSKWSSCSPPSFVPPFLS